MDIQIRNMEPRDINVVYRLAFESEELFSSEDSTWYPKAAL